MNHRVGGAALAAALLSNATAIVGAFGVGGGFSGGASHAPHRHHASPSSFAVARLATATAADAPVDVRVVPRSADGGENDRRPFSRAADYGRQRGIWPEEAGPAVGTMRPASAFVAPSQSDNCDGGNGNNFYDAAGGRPVRQSVVTGGERRANWESYAPRRGATRRYCDSNYGGVVGAPGGAGDWSYVSGFGPAAASASHLPVPSAESVLSPTRCRPRMGGGGERIVNNRVHNLGAEIGFDGAAAPHRWRESPAEARTVAARTFAHYHGGANLGKEIGYGFRQPAEARATDAGRTLAHDPIGVVTGRERRSGYGSFHSYEPNASCGGGGGDVRGVPPAVGGSNDGRRRPSGIGGGTRRNEAVADAPNSLPTQNHEGHAVVRGFPVAEGWNNGRQVPAGDVGSRNNGAATVLNALSALPTRNGKAAASAPKVWNDGRQLPAGDAGNRNSDAVTVMNALNGKAVASAPKVWNPSPAYAEAAAPVSYQEDFAGPDAPLSYQEEDFEEAPVSYEEDSGDFAMQDTEVPMDTPARKSLPSDFALRPFPGKGLGVVALRPFKKGEFIGNYEGEIMEEEVKDRRYLKSLQDQLTPEDREWIQSRLDRGQTLTGCYLYGVDVSKGDIYNMFSKHGDGEAEATPERIYVDAEDEYRSLWTRFINHASPPLNNVNPKSVPESWDGLPKVWFMANRDIEEGEEICFNYGDDYWLEGDEVV